MKKKVSVGGIIFRIVAYTILIFLAILSIMPFWIMIVNATRSTFQVQQSAFALLPSDAFDGKSRCTVGEKRLSQWWALPTR